MKEYMISRGGTELRVQLSDEALTLPRYAGAVPVAEVEAKAKTKRARRAARARRADNEGQASDDNAE